MDLRLESKESREAPAYEAAIARNYGKDTVIPWLLRFTKTLLYCLTEVYSRSREVAWEPGTAVHTSDLSSSVNNITVHHYTSMTPSRTCPMIPG